MQELHDLANDRAETTNLAGRHPDIVHRQHLSSGTGRCRATTAQHWARKCFAGNAAGAKKNVVTARVPSTRSKVLIIPVNNLKPALGCYGAILVKSPYMKLLAASDMRSAPAYCNRQ